MQKQYSKAFTLVELIVVITILAILGTISFISLQGYSQSARDSVRISDLSNISKGLELQLTKGGKVSIPEDKVDITASGTVISYQGYAGEQVLQNIGVHGGGKDPVDDDYYTYTTNTSLSKYQIMGFLENGDEISLLNNTFSADYSTRSPLVKGDQLGILLLSGSLQPIQETGIGVDIVNTNNNYRAYLNNDSSDIVSGTGVSLFTKIYNQNNELLKNKNLAKYDPSLIGYWDMETLTLTGGYLYFKDLSKYGNDGRCYEGTIINCPTSNYSKMYFNGINNRVRINNSDIFNPYNSDFTIITSFEILDQRNSHIVSKGGWSYNSYGVFTRGAGGISSELKSNPNNYQLTDYETIKENKKIFLASVFDRTSNKRFMFINSVKTVDISSSENESISNNTILEIGRGNAGYFYGNIYEVRIYNRALSESEIKSLYNITK